MVKNELMDKWLDAEKGFFQGWDFSYVKDRYDEGYPDWDYIEIAKQSIKDSNSVLDQATGGGEVFSEILGHHKPRKAVAIEGYKSNVSVARENLKKYGVDVLYAEEVEELPFKDGEFDLVLNRHGGTNVKELSRIICKEGIFLTQQVEASNWEDLMAEFGKKPKFAQNTLDNVSNKLEKEGFKILRKEHWEGKTVFKDVSSLVYVLKAIPWIVDDFSVEKYKDVLEKLHEKVQNNGKLEFKSTRFLIIARKIII